MPCMHGVQNTFSHKELQTHKELFSERRQQVLWIDLYSRSYFLESSQLCSNILHKCIISIRLNPNIHFKEYLQKILLKVPFLKMYGRVISFSCLVSAFIANLLGLFNSPKPWRVLETTFLLLLLSSFFFFLPFAYQSF